MKNQILQTNIINNKKVKIFKMQLVISLIGIIASIIFWNAFRSSHLNYKNYTKTLSQSKVLSSVYETTRTANSNILGTLDIPSLGINYAVFNEYNEELLKDSPCKFYGVNLGEIGNIAIAGHNFDNHTFFSDLDEIEINDEIYLYSNSNKKYTYSVYSCFETSSDDLDVLNTKFINSKELTLITCNNSNKKRFIVKAFLKSNHQN